MSQETVDAVTARARELVAETCRLEMEALVSAICASYAVLLDTLRKRGSVEEADVVALVLQLQAMASVMSRTAPTTSQMVQRLGDELALALGVSGPARN